MFPEKEKEKNNTSALHYVSAEFLSFMLKKLHRLSKNKDIKAVLKSGRTYYSPYFMLKLKKNDLDILRFAFVISTKISKQATKRNLARRRLSEIIRLLLPQLKTGFDCAILASTKLITSEGKVVPSQVLKPSLTELFKKAHLL